MLACKIRGDGLEVLAAAEFDGPVPILVTFKDRGERWNQTLYEQENTTSVISHCVLCYIVLLILLVLFRRGNRYRSR